MTIFRFLKYAVFLYCSGSLLTVGQNNNWSLDGSTVDENVIAGQLDNGLKYYIRENKKPEGRVFCDW